MEPIWKVTSSSRISSSLASYVISTTLFKNFVFSYGSAVFLKLDTGKYTITNSFFYNCLSNSYFSNSMRSQASGGALYAFGSTNLNNSCFYKCVSLNYGGGAYLGANSNILIEQSLNSYALCHALHGGSYLSDHGNQKQNHLNSTSSFSSTSICCGGSTMYPFSSSFSYIQVFNASSGSVFNIESKSGTTSTLSYSNFQNTLTATSLFSVYQSTSRANYCNFINTCTRVFTINSGSGSMSNCFSDRVLNSVGYSLVSVVPTYNVMSPSNQCVRVSPYITQSKETRPMLLILLTLALL